MKWFVTEGADIYGAGNVECDRDCGAYCEEIHDAGLESAYADPNTGVNVGQLCVQPY